MRSMKMHSNCSTLSSTLFWKSRKWLTFGKTMKMQTTTGLRQQRLKAIWSISCWKKWTDSANAKKSWTKTCLNRSMLNSWAKVRNIKARNDFIVYFFQRLSINIVAFYFFMQRKSSKIYIWKIIHFNRRCNWDFKSENL